VKSRRVGELHLELGEVDLALLAGRRLEPPLEDRPPRRPHVAKEVGQPGIPASVAQLANLAQQALARSSG
jgi:hypothetical protein